MLFNSVDFLIFLAFVFAAYWQLTRWRTAQNLFVLSASYVFYARWDYRFLSLIVISSVVDYVVGMGLQRSQSQLVRRLFLTLSLSVNMSLLGFFKYFGFFTTSAAALLSAIGFEPNLSTLQVILPVGISFYTFQTLSYTFDVYTRKIEATRDPIAFFAYVAFFPQLVAGPIERGRHLLPQFLRRRSLTYEMGVDGLRQMLWGFFKKVVIADNCAIFVDTIFAEYQQAGSGPLLLGAVLFSLQIYADFSGYSDIATGAARLLGFDLSKNFAFPYFSRDVAEFWRRWHISLTSWFRDYLYVPLGGSRVGQGRRSFNVLLVFIVSAFWHGGGWTFFIWGLLHALFYLTVVGRGQQRRHLGSIEYHTLGRAAVDLLRIIVTFALVSISWIFFRASTVEQAMSYLHRMVASPWSTGWALIESSGRGSNQLGYLALAVGLLFALEWLNRRNVHGLSQLLVPVPLRWLLYLLITFAIAADFYGERTFIYFQF